MPDPEIEQTLFADGSDGLEVRFCSFFFCGQCVTLLQHLCLMTSDILREAIVVPRLPSETGCC